MQLFTVVRNVKQAHEVLEHGETQDFDDDILYIMDCLSDKNRVSVRSLRSVHLKISIVSFQGDSLLLYDVHCVDG